MNRLRIFLLLILLLGTVGTTFELLLLGHFEDPWQMIPLVLLTLGILALTWILLAPSRHSLRVLQAVMLLFLVAGVLGLWLHLKGNAEFEQEMYPTLRGLSLLWESLRGATPALAPATMIWFGLLGMACTFRHPLSHKTETPA